ncbi:MAG: prepilin-type N-terminal cleavage/methylation domain-containing protein [Acidobacteriota bacterium]|nr:prepilin-type N-terminal cleavage/methylation domain-containing protein [Acidobacteriota bacterium]MDH3783955.1 prepilin-type N-terminal cleavage/methylation domain-containing protein [Acidobacteriota bacterium]
MSCRRTNASQSGLTLIELLVAVTVLALAMGVALVLYRDAQASYKVGDNLAEQQQVVRVASDRLTAALRMAGYNTNPDGNRSRPDEQIEVAHESAVFVRADFDSADLVAAVTPEETLDDGAYPTVTTGNDEIIGYVLAKEDGSSTETVTLWADVGEANRDGDVERVDIDGVELVQDEPPYTLYKVWLNNDPSQFGGGGFVLRAPLADNVRSLQFRYFDANGTEIAPPGGGDSESDREDRAAIRRITVDVEGQTRDPLELEGRIDKDDTDPDSRRFLKFRLSGDVSPRNLGKTGIPNLEADVSPPSTPTPPQLYPGHCGGLYAKWSPNPAVDEVSYYKLLYGLDPAALLEQRSVAGTGAYIDGLVDGTTYYVALTAVDAAGNQSGPSTAPSQVTQNFLPGNTPVAPLNLTATNGLTSLNGRVDLSWDAVFDNLGALLDDPQAPMLRDHAGYRLYRGVASGVVTTLVADEAQIPAYPMPAFSDDSAVNCRDYWYEVRGVDHCGAEGEASLEVFGEAESNIKPQVPGSVGAYFNVGTRGIRFEWQHVLEDINNDPIHIDSYIVGRAYLDASDLPAGNEGQFVPLPTQFRVNEYIDLSVVPRGQKAWYRVKAVDACSPANESDYSAAVTPACSFAGRVQINNPDYFARVTDRTRIQFEVTGPAASYLPKRIQFLHVGSGTVGRPDETFSGALPGSSFEYLWQVTTEPRGLYRLLIEVAQESDPACVASASVLVWLRPGGS